VRNQSRLFKTFIANRVPVAEIKITHAVFQYKNVKKQKVVVTVSNITSNSVVISPKTVIGELQPVTIDDWSSEKSSEPEVDVLQKVHIGTDSTLVCSGKDCLICCVTPGFFFNL